MNVLDLFIKIGAEGVDETTSKIDGLSSSVRNKLGAVAEIGGAALAAGVTAVSGAVVAMGKESLEAYANYEQLAGGISKLFGTAGQSIEEYAQAQGKGIDEVRAKYDQLTQAEQIAMQNAQQAYATAGMSVNQYMETASSFAAALTSSLGGDTVAAAQQADVAMRAISDNFNTFGGDISMIQGAFQGFAKQNYTMLDNLKLGYGGTKTEMERLIADANEWGAANGNASNLSIESFSDVVTAIQQIQEKQQIAGTTAREAAQTIEGSMNATKAAWENLLTEFGKEDGDVGARMTELAESAGNVVDNVIPRIAEIGESMAQALPELVPKALELGGAIITSIGEGLMQALPAIAGGIGQAFSSMFDSLGNSDVSASVLGIFEQIGTLVTENAPALIEKGQETVTNFANGILEHAPELFDQFTTLLQSLVDYIGEKAPELQSQAGDFILGFSQAVRDALPGIVSALTELLTNLVQAVPQWLPQMVEGAFNLIMGIATAIATNLPTIVQTLADLLAQLVQTVIEHAPEMIQAGLELLTALGEGINDAIDVIIGAIGGVIQGGVDAVGEFVGGFFNAGANLIGGIIDGIGSRIGEIAGMIESGLSYARELLPFSPAKRGPFSGKGWTLYSGMSLMDGFAEGIEQKASMAVHAVEEAAGQIYDAASGEISIGTSVSQLNTQEGTNPYGEMAVNVYIDRFENKSDDDVRTIAQKIGEYTSFELRARGYAC